MRAMTASHGAYKRVDVETASQGKLIVLLLNGAIQRAEEARRQLQRGRMQDAHRNLVRAQEIVSELRTALNMKAGTIAVQLDRVYEYIHYLLVQANVRKDGHPVAEAIEHITALRDTWQELLDRLGKEHSELDPSPRIDPHGAAAINMQG
jgi:flagellar protein FliS